jgi:hypothetical protein
MINVPRTQLDFEEMVAALLESYRVVKEKAVADAEDAEGRDTMLMLHWQPDHESGAVLIGMPEGTEHLDAVVQIARQNYGRPLWVALLADAYYRVAAGEEDKPVRGQLADEHAAGRTEVQECLMVHARSDRGFIAGRRLAYRYDDAGGVVFEGTLDDFADTELSAGWVPDCLALAFEEGG